MAGQTANYLFDYPTSTDYVKDGATAIETLADDVDATLFTALGGDYPGLRLVKKQTIGSAVSSVAVTSAFSSTYENYKILISGGVASGANTILRLQLGSVTTGYYSNFIYAAYSGGAVSSVANNNGANFNYAGEGDATSLNANMEVSSPFLAKQKMFSATYYDSASTGRTQGICDSTSSLTGFTIITSSGTLTGGTIYVYGYGTS